MEYRVVMTVADLGRDEANATVFLDAFLASHPENGPVVSVDIPAGTLSVVFALDARDADQAFSLGREIFASGSRASGLKPIRIVGVEITAVPDEEMAPETEAQAV